MFCHTLSIAVTSMFRKKYGKFRRRKARSGTFMDVSSNPWPNEKQTSKYLDSNFERNIRIVFLCGSPQLASQVTSFNCSRAVPGSRQYSVEVIPSKYFTCSQSHRPRCPFQNDSVSRYSIVLTGRRVPSDPDSFWINMNKLFRCSRLLGGRWELVDVLDTFVGGPDDCATIMWTRLPNTLSWNLRCASAFHKEAVDLPMVFQECSFPCVLHRDHKGYLVSFHIGFLFPDTPRVRALSVRKDTTQMLVQDSNLYWLPFFHSWAVAT